MQQKVWKLEWSEGGIRRIMEVCDRHSNLVMAAHPTAVGYGSYEASCEICDSNTKEGNHA